MDKIIYIDLQLNKKSKKYILFKKMIKQIVNKLIDELPENIIQKLKQNPNLNLILEGGVFNGSYLIGALYFLKEMEERKYINIQKFSGCSIGSICALLYLINEIEMSEILYSEIVKDFKEKYNLQKINSLLENIKERMKPNEYQNLNNRLYICYYNIETCQKEVQYNFKDNDEVIIYIKRSCFLPFFINGNIIHENKYLDGMFPHIFSLQEKYELYNIHKKTKDYDLFYKKIIINNTSKTIYFNLFSLDKLKYLLSIKNESNNHHRIITGILDIHLFFLKENQTQMCSFVEDWTFIDIIKQQLLKYIIEKIIIYQIYLIYIFKTRLFESENYKNNLLFKILKKIINETSKVFIDNYCF